MKSLTTVFCWAKIVNIFSGIKRKVLTFDNFKDLGKSVPLVNEHNEKTFLKNKKNQFTFLFINENYLMKTLGYLEVRIKALFF